MLTQENLVEIHVLHRQGKSVRGIAKALGISRNTVRRYLRDLTALPQYPDRAPRPTKLDPYKPYLVSRIEAAKPHWIPATVLLDEIRAHGYQGGISQLKAYIAAFKPVEHDPVVRFETPPGKQMQVDFTTISRNGVKIKAFVATLGYSRDRKSTRLNSSHVKISYAVFCLKKKYKKKTQPQYKLSVSVTFQYQAKRRTVVTQRSKSAKALRGQIWHCKHYQSEIAQHSNSKQ